MEKKQLTVVEEIFNGYKRLRKIVAVAITIVALGCAFGIYSVHHESDIRTEQFCKLNTQRYTDQLKQYNDTIKYLNSPQGREKIGINTYVRVTLPKQRLDLQQAKKTQPGVCAKLFTLPDPPKNG